MDTVLIFLCLGFFALIVFLAFVGSVFFTVEQQTIAVIERFGKFIRLAGPGFHTKAPFIEKIAGRVTLRVQQLDVRVETKTKDNVFVHVTVAVQYFVLEQKVYDAYYKLNDPSMQIKSFIFDVVRSQVPTIILDELFEKKDEIAKAVKTELNETMTSFGFQIVNALVTDIEPDIKVKEAMNEINSAQRLRMAAVEKGEADKILRVKIAEAEAQSKALQGKGIADQRKAIIEGLRESVDEFQKSIHGSSAQDVMNLVLLTQYFDTIKEIGMTSRTNTILIPHGPGAMKDLAEQLRDAMIIGNEVTKKRS